MKEYIKYLRYTPHADSDPEPWAVIVATDTEHIGWAMCHPFDRFDKYLGKRIARNRAERGNRLGVWNAYHRYKHWCNVRDRRPNAGIQTSRLFAIVCAIEKVEDYFNTEKESQ